MKEVAATCKGVTLVEPADPDKLKDAIELCVASRLANPDKMDENIVHEEFMPERYLQRLMKLYEKTFFGKEEGYD